MYYVRVTNNATATTTTTPTLAANEIYSAAISQSPIRVDADGAITGVYIGTGGAVVPIGTGANQVASIELGTHVDGGYFRQVIRS